MTYIGNRPTKSIELLWDGHLARPCFPGSVWEPISRDSASLVSDSREAEPPDLPPQAEPENEKKVYKNRQNLLEVLLQYAKLDILNYTE